MIQNVAVSNFKSLKDVSFNCERVNLFIGKPNSGKSNILESIATFSFWDFVNLKELISFTTSTDLIFELDVRQNLSLRLDDMKLDVKFPNQASFSSHAHTSNFFISQDGSLSNKDGQKDSRLDEIRSYKFDQIPDFIGEPIDRLLPTQGKNLPAVLYSNRELRNLLGNLMDEFHLEIVVRAGKNLIDFQRKADGIAVSYPISSISETLRRIVFYLAAIKTNKNSTILFEEPEAHAFPYYTRYLSELIASDLDNQYFISTHNPYFLLSMIEKTPRENLCVNLVSMKQDKTELKRLSESGLKEILEEGIDVFFNIERLNQ